MRTLTLGLLLVFLVASVSAAPEVDAKLLPSGAITSEFSIPLSADMRGKMAAVDQRRTAFAQNFEWGTPEEYNQRQNVYSAGMDAFARESEELKLEWNLTIGNDAEAARIAEHLRKLDAERRGEELNLERSRSMIDAVQKEGGQR